MYIVYIHIQISVRSLLFLLNKYHTCICHFRKMYKAESVTLHMVYHTNNYSLYHIVPYHVHINLLVCILIRLCFSFVSF